MAKGKGKPSASAGPRLRKNHGPKRHMFREYKPMVHEIAKAGILTKYHDRESFELALSARGIRQNIDAYWNEFLKLPTIAAKKEWFKNLKK